MSAAKETVNFGPFQEFFCQGVKTGNEIHLAGQVAIDDEGNVGADDIVAQTRQIYANIRRVLGELGATMDDIVDETWFVTDLADVVANAEPVLAARAEAYGVEVPQVTQTLVEVSGLWMPEFKIEVKCVARL